VQQSVAGAIAWWHERRLDLLALQDEQKQEER
jgi:hypothetical protein